MDLHHPSIQSALTEAETLRDTIDKLDSVPPYVYARINQLQGQEYEDLMRLVLRKENYNSDQYRQVPSGRSNRTQRHF